ncbi:hypothetical protein RHSIM_Rhsim10G0180800 [Rhododendron simsii]|uniref:Uncharacterized protein n=1 Tax=Rhododendron simsii TaxID=118357 RepID=A0A834LCW7_RHOSS|nr:hypothetical protein RHSIM_Rhsim10G0180800 [Rhododendron simsii]
MQVVKVYGNAFSEEFHSRRRFNHKGLGIQSISLARLGEVETDNDQPLDPPPEITFIEVLWKPFDDIVPRAVPAKALPSSTVDVDNKASKKIAVKFIFPSSLLPARDAREKKLDSPTEEVEEKKNASGESKSAKKEDKSSKEAREQQDHPNGTDPTNESDEAAVTDKAEVDTPVVDGKEKINKVA